MVQLKSRQNTIYITSFYATWLSLSFLQINDAENFQRQKHTHKKNLPFQQMADLKRKCRNVCMKKNNIKCVKTLTFFYLIFKLITTLIRSREKNESNCLSKSVNTTWHCDAEKFYIYNVFPFISTQLCTKLFPTDKHVSLCSDKNDRTNVDPCSKQVDVFECVPLRPGWRVCVWGHGRQALLLCSSTHWPCPGQVRHTPTQTMNGSLPIYPLRILGVRKNRTFS